MRFNRLSMIVVTMTIGLASVAAVAPGVSAQTALPVGQGQTSRVGTVLGGETATVDPVNAGTLRIQGIPGDFVTVDFTASTTYLGPTAIRYYSHRLGIGSGSTPGDGSAFNATVTFLAASE